MRGSVTFEGKRYYVSGKDRTEVEINKALKRKELEEGKKRISKFMRVDDWAEECVEIYKTNQAEITRYKYINRLKHTILSEIGDMPLSMVKSIHLQKILNSQRQFSQRHINETYQQIQFIFSKAVENGLLINNPAVGLTKPIGYKHTRRSLTPEEESVIVPLLDKDCYCIFALMYYAGLRPSEAENLKPSDIVLKDGIQMIHVKGTKTANAERFIPLSTKLSHHIENALERKFVALNTRSGKHNTGTVRNHWNMLMREAGIKDTDLVPYCLRHSFATRMAKQLPLIITKELMGHSSVEMTAQVYVDIKPSDLVEYAVYL